MSKPIHNCRVCGTEFTKKPYGKNLYCSHRCRGESRRVDPVASFWAKTVKAAGNECWLWTGGLISTGYGLLSAHGKLTLAHRYSYAIHNGTIADGLHVLHSCDNPRCVNPAHLFLGTNNDNIRDRMAKGRGRGIPRPSIRGANHHSAKLTDDAVREIRALAAQGIPHNEIARRFGVSHVVANKIVNRKSWVHVT
jgi:hypothetical protein